MTDWVDRTKRMHNSVSSTRGPSRSILYTLRSGATKSMRGVYEAPFKRQAAGDQDMETFVVERVPRVGVDVDSFTTTFPQQKGATVKVQGEEGKFRVTAFEATNPGWVEMLLEKLEG